MQLDADGVPVALTKEERSTLLPEFTNHGSALRVLAFAYKSVDLHGIDLSCCVDDDLEEDLILIGVIGLSDSVREEAPLAIEQCQRAGVEVKMLTGDNAETAQQIAQSCNILRNDCPSSPGAIIEGPDFRSHVVDSDGQLKTKEFEETWNRLKVMARCSPEDKYLLVRGIQSIRFRRALWSELNLLEG